MGFVHRRILTGVLAVVSHPWITLGCVLISVAACVGATLLWLTISTDQNQLFSSKPWFFHEYLEFIHRFPENEAVYIVIEPKNPGDHPLVSEWTDAADHITNRLRGMNEVEDAYCRIPIDELGRQGILFEDRNALPSRVAGAQGLGQLATIWGARPGLVAILGRTPIEQSLAGARHQPDDQTAAFITHLVVSWDEAIRHPDTKLTVGNGVVDFHTISAADPSELGYFYVPDETNPSHHRILIQVYPERKFNSLTAVTQTIDAIRNAAVDAGNAFPEFHVGVTGRPALEADQMATTDKDSHKAEIVALIVVFIGMSLMLRSMWLALAAEIALGVGIGWTFGWATAVLGELNLLSLVFLIALIGIGMDYLVQILFRYRLEARRYPRPQAVWVRVFKYVGPPINTACLGAAGAFIVAIFTDFRGAAELGIIAGAGLLLCLLAGYVVLPALLTIFPAKLRPLEASKRFKPAQTKRRAQWIVMPLIWLVLLLIGSQYMPRAHFDPGLIDLQVPNLESVDLIRTLQTWTAVVLSKDPDELRKIRAAVRPLPLVASTESVLEAQDNLKWLQEHAADIPKIDWAAPTPVTASDFHAIASKSRDLAEVFQPAQPPAAHPVTPTKAIAAIALRQFADDLENLTGPAADSAAARLSTWQNVFVQEVHDLLDQFRPESLKLDALPVRMREHFQSADGYFALYIKPSQDLWNDANLDAFESSVEAAVAKVSNLHVTGIASNVYHTTGAIHDAFFHSTIYALALIFVLVYLDFRRLGPTLMAISVLAMGLPMLVALMGLFHTSWNFANFFGLPILIGAGHEYGVFMVHRYLEAAKYPRRTWRRWDVSDRALLLCGFITSSSFGFFWLLAQHRGLKSLGLVMGLGAACIYLATVAVLRPLLKWRLNSIPRSINPDII
ncbi:MAG TPA: MMPL family transporter [Tepidisphaeraceae bacterium]|jgi:hypothetical protein